jgi:hypothetical protein
MLIFTLANNCIVVVNYGVENGSALGNNPLIIKDMSAYPPKAGYNANITVDFEIEKRLHYGLRYGYFNHKMKALTKEISILDVSYDYSMFGTATESTLASVVVKLNLTDNVFLSVRILIILRQGELFFPI